LSARRKPRRHSAIPSSLGRPRPRALGRKGPASSRPRRLPRFRSLAKGQPANAKGLEALNSAVVEYAGQWSSGRIGYAGDIGQRVVAVARRTLLGRRDAIFNQNRAGLIAELNDPASQLSTESLFNADRGFMARLEPFLVNRSRLGAMPARPDKSAPFYRSAVESWKSPRQAAGESMAGKEPTSEEIAYAILNSFRTGGARQMSPFAASMPYFDGRFGVQLMDALAPITFQIYDLRKRTCRREGAGFRCAYQVYAYTKLPNSWASHPFGGLMHEAFNGAYGATGEALLIPAGGGYRMPELDEAIIKAQMGQAEQMTKVLGAVADAAGSAFNVMNDAANPPRQPGAKSQMEQEQDDRIEEDKRRGRR